MNEAIKRRRFTMFVVVTIAVISAICSGCSGQTAKTTLISSTEPVINESYDENVAILTVKGERIQPNDERLSVFPDLGFGFLSPAAWFETPEALTFVTVEEGLCVGFLPPSISPDLENMSEDAIDSYNYEAKHKMQQHYIKIFFESSDNGDALVSDAKSAYQAVEKIATCGERTYYLAYNTNLSSAKLKPTATDEAAYQELLSSIDEIRDSMIIFPVVVSSADEGIEATKVSELTAQDMSGNTVTSEIFSRFDLTIINIWATWCSSCVDEIPDIARLYEQLPDGVNLITICTDADTEKEAAKKILDQSKAGFATLCGNDAIRTGLLANVISYPSIYFVDKNGAIVGEPLFGVSPSSEYMHEIESRLKMVK